MGGLSGDPCPPQQHYTRCRSYEEHPLHPDLSTSIYVFGTRRPSWGCMGGGGGSEDISHKAGDFSRGPRWVRDAPVEGRSPGWWRGGPRWPRCGMRQERAQCGRDGEMVVVELGGAAHRARAGVGGWEQTIRAFFFLSAINLSGSWVGSSRGSRDPAVQAT